jgi:tRNA/rRNA methyltransferase
VNKAKPLKNIRIVLCEPGHPGNIGAAARALNTMGLSQLYLVNPKRFPDAEAEWRATHATDILARATVCASLDEALSGVAFAVACSARSREVAVPHKTLREAATQLISVAHTQEVALVFGNEASGLTTAEVNKCRLLASIPADPDNSSLNLAAAVQVCAYELRMAVVDPDVTAPAPSLRVMASHEEIERFYAHLEQIMNDVGFLNSEHPKKLMPRLRRLFARAQLEKKEVNILRGILKALVHPKQRNKPDL